MLACWIGALTEVKVSLAPATIASRSQCSVGGTTKVPNAPAPSATPLAESGAEDRPLGVEARRRDVCAPVVDRAVDLIAQEQDAVLAADLAQRFELVGLVARAGGVARVVEDQQPGSTAISATVRIEPLGWEQMTLVALEPAHLTPCDASLRCIRDPGRRGQEQVPIERHLKQEHQLLAPGPDDHVTCVVARALECVGVPGDGLTEREQALRGQVVLLAGVLAQRVGDPCGDREGRLSQAELDDLPALRAERVAALVDRDRRRLSHPREARVEGARQLRAHERGVGQRRRRSNASAASTMSAPVPEPPALQPSSVARSPTAAPSWSCSGVARTESDEPSSWIWTG